MARKSNTYRIDPVVHAELLTLGEAMGRPLDQLVNEAVQDYVARHNQAIKVDLAAPRAYRKSDLDFEKAIADYVDAEISLKDDPAEGQRALDVGPAQARMLELLDS